MELLDRLIKFATLRPRSEFESRRWLARKKVNEEDGEVAIRELKKSGLIDDAAFVRWWADQRTTFRPKSQRMLLVEVLRKGVDKELAQQVLASTGLPTDEELAQLVLEKKRRTLEKLDPETRKKKIANILTNRGFGWGVINRTIENLK